jgi:hypothetical protein
MTWSIESEKALKAWLAPDTANSGNPFDEKRFYDFIAYVWIDLQDVWDESLARDKIKLKVKQLHSDWYPDSINDLLDNYLSKGTLILDFMSNAKKEELLTKFSTKDI